MFEMKSSKGIAKILHLFAEVCFTVVAQFVSAAVKMSMQLERLACLTGTVRVERFV